MTELALAAAYFVGAWMTFRLLQCDGCPLALAVPAAVAWFAFVPGYAVGIGIEWLTEFRNRNRNRTPTPEDPHARPPTR